MNDYASLKASPEVLARFDLSPELRSVVERSPAVIVPTSREQLIELALGGPGRVQNKVSFEVPGKGLVHEADVTRARNGVVVNFPEPYMRRRDPDAMVIADNLPTDQPRFATRFSGSFDELRTSALEWLASQPLILLGFYSGPASLGLAGVALIPADGAFFAAILADLQVPVFAGDLPEKFTPMSFLAVTPTLRHTHCDGKQMVVHNRADGMHEMFALNFYPGPSAKKGMYGVLLNVGEREGWPTLHAATAKVVTPYDTTVTFLHEGASGGGKSEMLEYPHRDHDGRLKLGKNVLTGEVRHIAIPQGCTIYPVTDDMAISHPTMKTGNRLAVADAEYSWFVRVNHITEYGTDPDIERLTINSPMPILFLSVQAQPGATALIWEHTEDSPGKRCPNPRVILPRKIVPNVLEGTVEVDVRSFGVRCPPCTKEKPTYGIMGLLNLLPPGLAWLWRLTAPRGHGNPSIITKEGVMASEGVGSFWPFATGRRVTLANILLRQIQETPGTGYVLLPNQHIGAWDMGFMPQWLAREYLARRGGVRFEPSQLRDARCSLLGRQPSQMQIEGVPIPRWFLQAETQPEVGLEAHDAGAEMLYDFFDKNLAMFRDEADLDPVGKQLIDWSFSRGKISEIPF